MSFFTRANGGGSQNHYHNVNVTEKRAPTDESVRLLKEMEKAAREKVLDTIVVADTSFECKIHKMYDGMNDQDVYGVVYSLGGIKYKTEVRVNRYENPTPQEVVIQIRDSVAQDIANVLIAPAFMKMDRV